MPKIVFPPVSNANDDGLLAVGGDLSISTLITAYSEGIFPWPIDTNYSLTWFSPDPRGVLFYSDILIHKSFNKIIKKNKFSIKFNTNFEAVIENCSSLRNRKGQVSTWITDDLKQAFIDLYNAGYAYSIETYNNENQLVGGIYGVSIGSYISGESMFYLEDNASKVALFFLMKHLYKNGILWIDTQMLTQVVRDMGGKEIPREDFLIMLKKSIDSSPQNKLFLLN